MSGVMFDATFSARRRLARGPSRGRGRRGAMLVLIALMLAGFMVALAFSVDIAQMHLSRTELRTSTDAAAKAAAGALSDSLDVEYAISRGQAIAAQNMVHGQPLLLTESDFQLGHSAADGTGVFQFTLGGTPTNSVRVNGRRTSDSPSGVIPLFFGNFLGRQMFEPQVMATATYIERDVVLVIDRSGSMKGHKWTALNAAIETFVDTLNETPVQEHVGLASYSNDATVDVALTEWLSQVTEGMSNLKPQGMTSISAGMSAGEAIFAEGRSSRFVERTMIVMTDGLHNTGSEPSNVAAQLAEQGIVIHTITFGSDADTPRMQEIAAIGGGRHFHASDGWQLQGVYREIALTLSTMMTE